MMRVVFANVKRHAAVLAVAVAALVAVAGLVLLLLATRPSRFSIASGEFLHYRLRVEITELLEDGSKRAPRVEEQEMLLVGTGPDNQAALAVAEGVGAQVVLVMVGSDGAVRLCDAGGHQADAGLATGWFDFSLCSLPPGSEQTWNADIVYAALPAQRRAVQAKARRLRSGSTPEFQLKLPIIEWINKAGFYEQIRDLTCTYRFANSKHAVESAVIELQSGAENGELRRRLRWRIELLLASRGRIEDPPRAIRDLALTGMAIQDALAADRRERLAPLQARLVGIEIDDPRLRELARRIADRARISVKVETPSRSMWAVQVASVAAERKSEAERLARQLTGKGLRAYVTVQPQGIAVMVGPYPERDQAILSALVERFPSHRLAWSQVEKR